MDETTVLSYPRRWRDAVIDWALHFKEWWGWARRVLKRFPAWITPNGVTVARMALVVPILWLIAADRFDGAFVLAVVSFVGDFVDGALAHVRGQFTELGKVLDPLADKVVNYAVLGFLLPKLPAVFTLPVVACAGIGLALTGWRLHKMVTHRLRGEPMPASPANGPGKVKAVSEMVGISALLFGLAFERRAIPGGAFFVWFGGALLALSIPFAVWSLRLQRRA